ncbi:uncharacterized protein NESG_00452 [Nematocida ausubeli]|uniref:Uncharacterized protein n=1 Tax=Nematocida ausubeli (strain ATCC PRA-371 / ERTm2) TaxID=1913371 RepID=A0A086J5F6_NEMA1|nr:uncharacterized protein NESG_00452 [Nematocida ausubeli]KFG27374.1 hypothetical protein NESG_00452 [Nematocida ausubeli]
MSAVITEVVTHVGQVLTTSADAGKVFGLFGNGIGCIVTSSTAISVATAAVGVLVHVAMMWFDISQTATPKNPNVVISLADLTRERFSDILQIANNTVISLSLLQNIGIMIISVISAIFIHVMVTFSLIETSLAAGKVVGRVASVAGMKDAVEYPEEGAGFMREDVDGDTPGYFSIKVSRVGRFVSIFSFSKYEILMMALRSSCLVVIGFVVMWLGSVSLGYLLPSLFGTILRPNLVGLSSWSLMGLDALTGTESMGLVSALFSGLIDWATTVYLLFIVFFKNTQYLTNIILSFITTLFVIPAFYSLARLRPKESIKSTADSAIYVACVLLSIFLGMATLIVMLYPIRVISLVFPLIQRILEYPLRVIACTSSKALDQIDAVRIISSGNVPV